MGRLVAAVICPLMWACSTGGDTPSAPDARRTTFTSIASADAEAVPQGSDDGCPAKLPIVQPLPDVEEVTTQYISSIFALRLVLADGSRTDSWVTFDASRGPMETVESEAVTIETRNSTVTATYVEDRQPFGVLRRWDFAIDGTFVAVQAWNVSRPHAETLIANLRLGGAEELAATLEGHEANELACLDS